MKYNLYFHCSENAAFYIFTAVKYSFLKICIIFNQYFPVFHYFVYNKCQSLSHVMKKNENFFFVSITFSVIYNSHKATSLLAFAKDTSMLVYPTICICDQRSISPLRKNSINLKNRFLLRFRQKTNDTNVILTGAPTR